MIFKVHLYPRSNINIIFHFFYYRLEAVIHSIDDAPINTIFHNYNKYARASTDDTPVNVTYSMSIKRIVGFVSLLYIIYRRENI